MDVFKKYIKNIRLKLNSFEKKFNLTSVIEGYYYIA